MGLFDKMKQATAATGGNQTVTFTFQALPESLAQMQALPESRAMRCSIPVPTYGECGCRRGTA